MAASFPKARPSAIAALVVAGGLAAIGFGAIVWRRLSAPAAGGAAQAKLIKPGSAIAIAGDSIGQGLAGPVAKMASAIGAKLVCGCAEKSTLIPTWSRSEARIQKILASKPSVILISLGTNDAAASAPDRWSGEVDRLADRLASGGADLIWIESPSQGLPNMQAVRAMIEGSGAARSGKLRLLDGAKVGAELGADHVHPTGKGYGQITGELFRQYA